MINDYNDKLNSLNFLTICLTFGVKCDIKCINYLKKIHALNAIKAIKIICQVHKMQMNNTENTTSELFNFCENYSYDFQKRPDDSQSRAIIPE